MHVEDFLKEINEEPSDLQKAEYFKTHKDKAADPSLDDRGLLLPMRVKIEYVMADPTSKEYLGLARTVEKLKTATPVFLDAVESPLAAAALATALGQMRRNDVENHRKLRPSRRTSSIIGTPFCLPGSAIPIMTWLAKRHPEAVASMIGNGFAGPTSDMVLAGYMGVACSSIPMFSRPA